MLLNLNKKELEELGRLYGIKGVSKLKKTELTDALLKIIPENMTAGLVMLELEDIALFEELIEKDKELRAPEDILEYYVLVDLGLINFRETRKSIILSVDEAVKEGYKNLDTSAVKVSAVQNSGIRTHITGLLNLYGAAEVKWVCELYNRSHTDKLSEKELNAFVKKDRELLQRAKVETGYIADETVYSIDAKNLQDFIQLTKDKPYYVPSKEYIELLSNEFYYDNTLQVQKLKSYLKKNFTQEEEIIEEAILAVVMIARVDCDKNSNTMGLMLEEWRSLGIEVQDLVQANEVVKHIAAVINMTRKWINKGFTPLELSASRISGDAGAKVRKLEVERNALCLCGSGKKYKKCCGKPKND